MSSGMGGFVVGRVVLDNVRNRAHGLFLIFYAEILVFLQFCGKDGLTNSVIYDACSKRTSTD